MANPFNTNFTKEDLKGLDFDSGPTKPFLGPAFLVSVDMEKTIKHSTKQEWDTLNFHFKLGITDEETGKVVPTNYEYKEWYPESDDPKFMSKGQNMIKRLQYILHYFVGDDKAKEIVENWSEWDELRRNIVNVFKNMDTSKKKLRVKLTPNVQTMRVGFPGYIGFISDENSEKQVEFTPSELKDIATFNAKLRGEDVGTDNRAPVSVPDEEEFQF